MKAENTLLAVMPIIGVVCLLDPLTKPFGIVILILVGIFALLELIWAAFLPDDKRPWRPQRPDPPDRWA